MNTRKLMLATAVISSLVGLYGCSEGDEAEVVIDSVTNNTSGGSSSSSTISENCPTWAAAKNKDADGNDVCALPSAVLENRTLTSDVTWYMEGRVTVGNGNGQMSDTDQDVLANDNAVLNVVLTIEAGTSIKAKTGTFANLLITRGSQIQAVGTAAAPIVFSSDDSDFSGNGEWGGLIIHGYGDHNQCPATGSCNIDAEGESGFAGGIGRSDDNSGRLSYVVVTEGGYEFSTGNEINGVSLVAVGSGTTIDHIQVNANDDDGVEFYGGDVNVKYMVLTGNLDDSIDWDEGYQGNIQYVIVKQVAESKGNTIEADTEGSLAFLSKPTLANVTFIADGSSTAVHRLKKVTGGFIVNSVMTIVDGNTDIVNCADITTETQDNINTDLVYENVIADCPNLTTAYTFAGNIIEGVDPQIDANYAAQAAEANGLAFSWTDFKATYANSVADDAFLDETDYAGAIDPDATSFWYTGWIVDGTL